MKKIILLAGVFLFVFAKSATQKDIYLDYTNKVINYEFTIKNLNNIKTPFYEPPKYFSGIQMGSKNSRVKKRVKITLISIFGNKAYIKIQEYLGEQLVKTDKKWISLNHKIYGCRLSKLTQTDAVFKCGGKILHKTINQKIPMLRDTQ